LELESGTSSWDVVMGNTGAWEAAGIDPSKARETLRAAAALFTPRGSPADEVRTTQQRDRKTALKLLLYDQLPETTRAFAELIKLEEQAREDGATEVTLVDPGLARLSATEDVREAVRFAARLELIASDEERVRERLQRLRQLPLARGLLAAAELDVGLTELAGSAALEPLLPRLYNATRTAQLRARPQDETRDDRVQVMSLEFNLLQALGVLVVIAALAYGASQLAKGALKQRAGGGDQMPVYSLSSTEARR